MRDPTRDQLRNATASSDPETRLEDDDHASLRLWLRMFTSTALIERELAARLKLEFGSSLSRFDLLAQLDRAHDGLRMTELSQRLLVTGGNVTWLVTSLEGDGLVERRRVAADGRAVAVRLTAVGRRHFATMARAHEQWVTELLSGLSAEDRLALHARLGDIKERVILRRSRRAAPGRSRRAVPRKRSKEGTR